MSDNLIEQVRNYEVLYNTRCKGYKDQLIRTAAWTEIAKKLKEPVEKCKDDWTKLRNAYASALKRRKKKGKHAATQIAAWKYEEQINFLRPHMETRTKRTNLTTPTPESFLETVPYSPPDFFSNESQSSSASHPPPSSSSSDGSQRSSVSKRSSVNKLGLQEIYDLMKSSNDVRQRRQHYSKQDMDDMDENDLFFLSMSKAVKALPKLDQTKIKLDLHTAVSQAEVRKLTGVKTHFEDTV